MIYAKLETLGSLDVDFIIRSDAYIEHIKEDYQLIITGEKKGTYSQLLKKTGKTCLSDDIVFTGFIPEEEMPVMINAASLFVFPSLYEGFGIPVLEAMAAGCPVIVGKNSSIPEVAGEAGYYTNVEDEVDLMNAIKVVLSDNELRNTLIKKGKKQARKFSWNKTIKETIDFMFEVTHKIPLKK